MDTLSERYIDARSEQVWMLVSSVNCMPRWLTFAQRAELVDGDGVGRRQLVRGPWHPLCSCMEQEVTTFDPSRELVWRVVSEERSMPLIPKMSRSTQFTIRLIPEGGGTRVVFETCQVPAGPLRGIAMKVAGQRLMERHLRLSLAKLDELVGGRCN